MSRPDSGKKVSEMDLKTEVYAAMVEQLGFYPTQFLCKNCKDQTTCQPIDHLRFTITEEIKYVSCPDQEVD